MTDKQLVLEQTDEVIQGLVGRFLDTAPLYVAVKDPVFSASEIEWLVKALDQLISARGQLKTLE